MNYETQMIALEIDNDEYTSKLWRNHADIIVNGTPDTPTRWWEKDDRFNYLRAILTGFTDRDRCTAVLRHLLKEEWMDECYDSVGALQEPFKDILMGAMSEVSWQEIAEDLIEGLVERGDYPSTWDDEG